MEEKIKIEVPRIEDLEDVNKLAKQVHELHVKWRPDLFLSVDEVINKDDFKKKIEEKEIYVAKINNKILGYVIFNIKEKDIQIIRYRKVLSIEAICVDKENRKRGIGKSILEFVKNIAKEKGCTDLYLTVNEENKDAIKFYEDFGFKVKNIAYSIKI